jgi:hypothetical protein
VEHGGDVVRTAVVIVAWIVCLLVATGTMTQYVATVIDATTWAVIRSNDGVSGAELLGTFPSAKSARAFIASRVGELSPLRPGQPIEPDAQGVDAYGAAGLTGAVSPAAPRHRAGPPSIASSPSGDALGRSRAGRSRREVGPTVERR